MKRKTILLILSAILVIPAALFGLMASEPGSRWLLQTVFANLPGEASAGKTEGTLLHHLRVSDFHYRSDTETVSLRKLEFTWQPSNLLLNTLKISDFTADRLDIKLKKSNKKPEKDDISFYKNFKLPVKLDIGNFLITDAGFQYGETGHHLNSLQFSVVSEAEQIKLLSFRLVSGLINADAKGYVTLKTDMPLSLDLNWRVNAGDNGVWQGLTLINGNLRNLRLDNRMQTPFSSALTGNVRDVLSNPAVNIQAEWQDLHWPFNADAHQIQSQLGRLTLTGQLDDFKLNINGKLSQHALPQADLVVEANGSLDSIKLNKLELNSKTGQFELTGQASWHAVPAFAINVKGNNFDPAILVPELPGNLTFDSHIKGTLEPKALQIKADILKMAGQLRKQPFNAGGKLNLNGEQLAVENLNLSSGKNKLSIGGALDKLRGDLRLVIDMPNLAGLWPELAGKLSGNAMIQGGWGSPAIKSDLRGKRLRFRQHCANSLTFLADYSPGAQKKSTLNLSAENINSSNVTIDKLSIDGSGNLKRHEFNANISSPQASLTAALTGSLADKQWRGELAKLDIKEPGGKLWTLNKTAIIQLTKNPDGIEASFTETCLVQQSASLCGKGVFPAGGGLDASLSANAMPTTLINPLLPEYVKLNTLIDGNADIQSKNKQLTGQYRFNTTPAMVTVSTDAGSKDLQFGSSEISGTIKGSQISANLNLNLHGTDFLRSRLLIDSGKTQTISGQVTTAVTDFALLQAIAPQLSNVKGQLTADLAIIGSLSRPDIKGKIDLANGNIDSGRFGLRQLNFQVLAPGGAANPLQLRGSAVPEILNQPGAAQAIKLLTQADFSADLHPFDIPSGNFRISLAPDTVITLLSDEQENGIKLGATSITGLINGDMVSAELDIALKNQDYLHSKIALNTGNSQALSGQATASIRHLEWLELLAPDLANVKGFITADLTLNGTTQNPLVNGAIKLDKGEAGIEPLAITVRDISLQASAVTLNSNEILLRGSAKSGEGAIKLEGTATLQPGTHWPVTLSLTGSDFEVAKLPEAQITLSPALQFQSKEKQKKISGILTVPKAILKIQEIPENAVKVSEDEIILGEEKSDATAIKEPDIEANIDVILGQHVSFTGQGLQTDLNGNLKITKAHGKLSMQGNVDMKKANYKRFGQNLTVRKGKFLFNGPADNPWLDVEAIRVSKSKKVTAILSLHGTMKNPQTRIYSEPSLPETEALAYLVTGNPLSQASKSESNMLASAALSYGAGKATWLADKLGIHEFNVEEGSTLNDTLLTMGQYLTPDFYVGTRVGMFNKQAALVLKHKLTDRINVETQTGTSQRIKLNYEFDKD